MIPTQKEWMHTLEMRHGAALHKRFSDAAVAVCGLGGLGSNIAVSLVRAGVGRLILIDFDRVDITNLHRQQYKACQIGRFKTEALAENLREIAPYVQLETRTMRVTTENCADILRDAQVVCEAFDDPYAKAMLTDQVLGTMPDKYLVAASGMAGMGSPNTVRTKKLTPRFYLCGDGVSEVGESCALISTRVMLCAAHQAHTVLRLLAGEYEV